MRAPWNISNFPLEDHRYSEACYGKCHPGSFGKKSPRPDFPLHFGMKRNYGYSSNDYCGVPTGKKKKN